jgi:hypothetical protein
MWNLLSIHLAREESVNEGWWVVRGCSCKAARNRKFTVFSVAQTVAGLHNFFKEFLFHLQGVLSTAKSALHIDTV